MFKNNVDQKKLFNSVSTVEDIKTPPLIKRIPPIYVSDDCVQLMINYKNSMITLDNEGIIFNCNDREIYKHDYIYDDRKSLFPYSSIPRHYDKKGNVVVNQILEFDKSYIYLIDGVLSEKYVTRYNDETYVFSRTLIGYPKELKTMNYKELKEYLDKESKESICINLDGTIPDSYEIIPSEEEINNIIKNDFKTNVEKLHSLNDESTPYAYPYILLNKWFIEYLKNAEVDLTLMDFDYEREQPLLIVKYEDNKINLEALRIIFKRKDTFEIIKHGIFVNKYSLENLQNIKISDICETNISLNLNPEIDKEDLEKEKRLFKKIDK